LSVAGRKTAQQEEKRKRVFHNAPPTYFDTDGAVAFYNRRAEAIKRASPRPPQVSVAPERPDIQSHGTF
jgi:hypothetical protein